MGEFDLSFFQNFAAAGIIGTGAAILAAAGINVGVNLYEGGRARRAQRRAAARAEERQRELQLEERERAFQDSFTASLLAGQTRRPRGRTGINMMNGEFGGGLTPQRQSRLGGGRSLLGS